jgi:serine protease AprX
MSSDPKYRIFLPQAEIKKLPSDVTLIEKYPAFTIVNAPESTIENLRKDYPIEKLKAPSPPPQIPGVANLATTMQQPQKRGPYLVAIRFNTPVKKQWLTAIEKMGCTLYGPLGNMTVVISCPTKSTLTKVRDLPRILSVTDYIPDLRLSAAFLQGLGIDANATNVAKALTQINSSDKAIKRSYNISVPGILVATFFTNAFKRRAKKTLEHQGVSDINKAGEEGLTINLSSEKDIIRALQNIVRLPGLRLLEEKKLRKSFNNVARKVIADRVVTTNPSGLGLTGKGEVVAVADTGLDTGDKLTIHSDFMGRVKAIQSYPITPSYSTDVTNPNGDDGSADRFSDHGTHVSGSILGNGARSIALGIKKPIQGVASEATLVFQAIEQAPKWTEQARLNWILKGQDPPASGLFGIPEDLQDLFKDAYSLGARIHSNSWGGGDPGAYDIQCRQLDQFVWDHKDFLIVVAGGNSGSDTNPRGEGIDPISVDSPGTAKNCLTVGASENDRPGEFTTTYGQGWPDDYPKAPFKNDKMVDSIDDIVAFSSRGPCTSGRRKPDVVAPGTFILSTRSSQMPTNNFAWAPFPEAKHDYMFMGGTSMATPLVAGCAVLVRQHLRQTLKVKKPSAALLKATIIHSAQYLNYRYAHPSSKPFADNEQGWGRVDLKQTLNPKTPTKVLFLDEWQGLKTGDLREFKLSVKDGSVPLRITLVYSDYPGEDLINNLNLFAVSPDSKTFIGNDFDNAGTIDSLNNVEGVVIKKPKIGLWVIRVVGSDVPQGPQDFAVVISGGGITIK